MNFLKDTVYDIITNIGNDLSNVVIITPSRRTGLFMNKYFQNIAGTEIILPAYTNIIKFCEQHSKLTLHDDAVHKINLIWQLYQSYISVEKLPNVNIEPFDRFYFFGETLLSDFNDIDMSLVDAKILYGNINEWENFSFIESLTDEQKQIIQKFFNCDTELKKRFSFVWNNLYEVYEMFKKRLLSNGYAYEGMIMRDVVESSLLENLDKQYVLIGYNDEHLKRSELNILNTLRSLDNILEYKESITTDKEIVVKIVDSPSNIAQTGYITTFLNDLDNPNFDEADTAIVLCDESLLLPTIDVVNSNIPQNIAILFSLTQTNIAGIVFQTLEQLTTNIAPEILLKNLQSDIIAFSKENKDRMSDIEKEACYNIHQIVEEIFDIYRQADSVQLTSSVLSKLLRRIISSIRIPFYSEPAKGLQIMAPADTRNMNFKNICFLSANENFLPKRQSTISFIPHSIRKYFGLQTIDKQEMQEYYEFGRLISNAQNISIVYSSNNISDSGGEMSRFAMQMLVPQAFMPSQNFKVSRYQLETAGDVYPTKTEIIIEKTPEIMQTIMHNFDAQKILSPSAINNYVECSLRFFFKYIAKIESNKEEIALDAALLGSVVHRCMEILYQSKPVITSETIDNYLCDEHLSRQSQNIITDIFNAVLSTDNSMYTGEHLIYLDVIQRMILNVLLQDKLHTPFKIIGLEQQVNKTIQLDNFSVAIGGVIDRIDNIGVGDNGIRIVDYKTGAYKKNLFTGNIDGLLGEERIDNANYILQLLIYSYILSDKYSHISSTLLYPLQSQAANLEIDFESVKESFIDGLTQKLKELFVPDIPFSQCNNTLSCVYCDYKSICGRQ